MALTPSDQPSDLPCGSWGQDEVDELNDWRATSFQELISLRTAIQSLQQALNSTINGIPSQICNFVSDRFYEETVTGNALSITLPSGGAYKGVFILNIAENGVAYSGATWSSGEGDTDDDRNYTGSQSGIYAGGFTMSIAANNSNRGSLTFFGYRIDC